MEILTSAELLEWVRLDADQDTDNLIMLEASAIDVVEHLTGLRLRPHLDDGAQAIVPHVPQSLRHAIAVLVHAHFDNRTTSVDSAMKAAECLCAPFRVLAL